MKNMVRCTRCRRVLIAEYFESHECDTPLNDLMEISVSSIFDCSTNGNKTMVARDLKGNQYWLKMSPRTAVPYPSEDDLHKVLSDENLQPTKSDEELTEPERRVAGRVKVEYIARAHRKSSLDHPNTLYFRI